MMTMGSKKIPTFHRTKCVVYPEQAQRPWLKLTTGFYNKNQKQNEILPIKLTHMLYSSSTTTQCPRGRPTIQHPFLQHLTQEQIQWTWRNQIMLFWSFLCTTCSIALVVLSLLQLPSHQKPSSHWPLMACSRHWVEFHWLIFLLPQHPLTNHPQHLENNDILFELFNGLDINIPPPPFLIGSHRVGRFPKCVKVDIFT